MATLFVVPTFTDPFYTIKTDLDGQEYILDFAFNARENCWYLRISDTNENEIRSDIKLVCNAVLGEMAYNPLMPAGQLIVFSNTNDDSPPGLLDLDQTSGRCTMYYIGDS